MSDQLLKLAVRFGMEQHQSVAVLGDLFRLTYVENRAAVMGISLVPLWVITLASLPALIFMAWWMWRHLPGGSWMSRIMPWLLGGATGNLFDRMVFGQVTDMLDVDIPDITWLNPPLERWWVFNLADAYIFVGMILILLLSISGKLEEEASGAKGEDPTPPQESAG